MDDFLFFCFETDCLAREMSIVAVVLIAVSIPGLYTESMFFVSTRSLVGSFVRRVSWAVVLDSLRGLWAFVSDVYLAAIDRIRGDSIACSDLPNGSDHYAQV